MWFPRRPLTLYNRVSNNIIPKRWKRLREVNFRRLSDPHELAIQHNDKVMGQYFKDKWPSIRCALLSRRKFAALVNNHYQYYDNTTEELELTFEAIDMMANIRNKANDISIEISKDMQRLQENNFTAEEFEENLDLLDTEQSLYNSFKNTCKYLKLYSYPREVIKEIPSPIDDEYFVIDAASVLPIIALDPHQSDDILDMVASPGTFVSFLLQCPYSKFLNILMCPRT